MHKPALLFSGLPRSGKTTVAKRVAEATGLKYISPGELVKDFAGDKKIEFHKYFSVIPDDILNEIIDTVVEIVQEGDVIFDGRCEPVICKQAGLRLKKEFFPVYITAKLGVRAQREANLEGITVEKAERDLQERENAEASFCCKKFGGDYRDRELYIGMIDTGKLTPDETYSAVINLLLDGGYFER
ncbi:MAG: AAA family ATPase [Candidatus Aenigmatarchaeota archaeon]